QHEFPPGFVASACWACKFGRRADFGTDSVPNHLTPMETFQGPWVVKWEAECTNGAKSPQADKARTRHGHDSDKPGTATDTTDTADSPDTISRLRSCGAGDKQPGY